MRSKVKVEYVEASNLEDLKILTNKAIDAIQVNIRNIVKDVDLSYKPNNNYIVQITYEELEDTNEILNG